MAAEIIINKVVVTDEAKFDYECLFNRPIPKADIKRETEEYIDGRQGRINGFISARNTWTKTPTKC